MTWTQAARLTEMSRQADVVIGAGDFASIHQGHGGRSMPSPGSETPTVLVPGNNETLDALKEATASWSRRPFSHGGDREARQQDLLRAHWRHPGDPWTGASTSRS